MKRKITDTAGLVVLARMRPTICPCPGCGHDLWVGADFCRVCDALHKAKRRNERRREARLIKVEAAE